LPDGTEISASTYKALKDLYDAKTTVENQKVEVVFPLRLGADDYVEFSTYAYVLEQVTKKIVNFEESSDKTGNEKISYFADFWIGEVKPSSLTKKKKCQK
jgi:hypothetical protein